MHTVDNNVIYGVHTASIRRVSSETTGGMGGWGFRLSPETTFFAESGLIRGHLAAG